MSFYYLHLNYHRTKLIIHFVLYIYNVSNINILVVQYSCVFIFIVSEIHKVTINKMCFIGKALFGHFPLTIHIYELLYYVDIRTL